MWDRICDLPILFAILEKGEEGRLWVSEDFWIEMLLPSTVVQKICATEVAYAGELLQSIAFKIPWASSHVQ